jgi:hypothetical protein
MSPSEALKHPFMAEALLSAEELERVFGAPTGNAGGASTGQDSTSSDESDDASSEADQPGEGSSEEDLGPEGDSSPEEAPNDSASSSGEPSEEETDEEDDQPTIRPAQYVEADLTHGTTALERWNIATKQIEQQFNTAYSKLAGDKARLKAAGFTKGKKFSDYFTYNQRLHKLIQSLEKAKAKRSKDVPKLAAKVTAATQHYRDKITRKADTDFGWANAQPPVTPPFWKTMIAALDDVDQWAKS